MTDPNTTANPAVPAADRERPRARRAAPPSNPVLAQLARCYPAVFGPVAQPLQRGIFRALAAAHPELPPAELKAALAQHTRSTRYLRAVAAGRPRLGLDGAPVEPVSLEHRLHALFALARRLQGRQSDHPRPFDLHAQLLASLKAAGDAATIEACRHQSGRSAAEQDALDAAIAEYQQRAARDEALLRAFEGSGVTLAAWAERDGLTIDEATAAVTRARQRRHRARTKEQRDVCGTQAADADANAD